MLVHVHTAEADGGINHHNVLLVVTMQVINQLAHLVQGEAQRIQCEDASVVHIVNVGPHSFQRNSGLTIVIDNFSDSVDIPIAVSALVELRKIRLDLGPKRYEMGNLHRRSSSSA